MMEAESSPLYWQLEQIINVPHASYLRLYIELPADSCELPRGTSDTRMSPLIGANTATPSFQREEGRTASTLGRQPEGRIEQEDVVGLMQFSHGPVRSRLHNYLLDFSLGRLEVNLWIHQTASRSDGTTPSNSLRG